MNKNFNIDEFLSLQNYATNERQKRRKGSGGSQEYFTPSKLIRKMADKISEEKWSDINADFLEPCAGNGQMVIYIIYNKIMHGSSWLDTLQHTWSVELLEDNVKETHKRIHDLFEQMHIDYDKEKAQEIMNHNLVCHNFFNWDFKNWCPIKEEKALPLF